MVIEYRSIRAQGAVMTHLIRFLAVSAILVGLAQPAAAQCFADYKAKQDNPLRLHYGVMQLQGPCDRAAARAEVAARLNAGGWTLLNVLSVFGPEGLAERKANAAGFYLRF
jgi:hypothetical protein|tara:strand:+ start:127 stop:459 length:333 start_codon:yes stop_codon:yes gene_type:complete